MPDRTKLEDCFAAFETIQDEIIQNGAAAGPDWRNRLVGLRRNLQDRLVGMRAAVQDCANQGGDAAACQEFAEELSSVRATIAGHQARWPAVAIITDSAADVASLDTLRRSGGAFRASAPT